MGSDVVTAVSHFFISCERAVPLRGGGAARQEPLRSSPLFSPWVLGSNEGRRGVVIRGVSGGYSRCGRAGLFAPLSKPWMIDSCMDRMGRRERLGRAFAPLFGFWVLRCAPEDPRARRSSE